MHAAAGTPCPLAVVRCGTDAASPTRLLAQVGGWEAWMLSQKKQKRAHQKALLHDWRESPDALLRTLLAQVR